MTFQNIAIIGAGMSGLALALFLRKQHLSPTIYERFDPSKTSEGAMMLSPNALRTLDALGVYERIKGKGYSFRDLHFNTVDDKKIDTYEMGNAEKFGYDALRVYRQVLLDELRKIAVEAGVEIRFGKRFERVVSEDEGGVAFVLEDGEEVRTDLLIGSDGIHSAVRKHLAADVVPVFQNAMGVSSTVPKAAINFPYEDYHLPAGVHGSAGGFLMCPQNPDESELFAGIQYDSHERTRAEWEALSNDKEQLFGMIKATYDSWNPMIKSAIDAMRLESMTYWPYYSMPKLERWVSERGRVVMMGDAAHAVPPSSGQGVNQAFEDAHALSLVMKAAVEKKVSWDKGLAWWQDYRRARMDGIDVLIQEMNMRRQPSWKGESAGSMDSSWLYCIDIESDFASWLKDSSQI